MARSSVPNSGSTTYSSASPLDAERQKLKSQGYTDAEISQILIARAAGGQQPSSSSTQGTLSNVLSSMIAIAGHARSLMPSFRTDFVTIFSAGAPIGSRIGAMFTLSLKTAVIGILAYAGWQEWQQHIVSATAIAESESRKRHAEECSARSKMIGDTIPIERWAEAMPQYLKDCDPTYAERTKRCDARFQSMMGDIDGMNWNNAASLKKISDELSSYRSACTMTEDQSAIAKKKVAAAQGRAKK